MPKNKKAQLAQDYRKLTLVDLDKKLARQCLNLQELRAQLAIGKLTNHQAIAQARRAIARIKTVKQEKIILEELSHGK